MRIADLKIFLDLINSQSCSRCAELNFLTQPAISQKIKQFEIEFKAPLFIRDRNSIKLTSAGKIVYEESQKIVNNYQELQRKINLLSDSIHGKLKLATIYSIGLYELDRIVKVFIRKYPAVHLDFELSHAANIYEQILNEKADIGIVAYPDENPCMSIIPYKNEELALVTHPDHPLAGHKKIDIKKIDKQDFVGFETGVPTGEAIKSILNIYGVNVAIKMEFDNIEMIKRAVEINAGVSILPKMTVNNEVDHGILKCIPFHEKLFRPIAIIVKKNRTPSAAVQKFIGEMVP